MRAYLIGLILSIVSISPLWAKCDPGEYIIRMSHSYRVFDNPIGDAAETLSRRINEEFNGAACMEVFGNAILYTDKGSINALLEEDIHFAVPSFAQVEDYTNVLQVFSLPFVFKNTNALDDFLQTETGKSLLYSMRGHGVKGLSFWYSGMLQMSASEAFGGDDAFQDKTFRSAGSALSIDQFEALGATTKEMAFSEVFSALETREIDGTEDTYANFFSRDIYKVQSMIVETNHSVGGGILITSQKWFDRLHPDFQKRLVEIIGEVTTEQRKTANSRDKLAMDNLIRAGAAVRQATPEERDAWKARMKTVWEDYAAGVNPVFSRFIDQINARN